MAVFQLNSGKLGQIMFLTSNEHVQIKILDVKKNLKNKKVKNILEKILIFFRVKNIENKTFFSPKI